MASRYIDSPEGKVALEAFAVIRPSTSDFGTKESMSIVWLLSIESSDQAQRRERSEIGQRR
jgi:hypothetical protein